MINNDLKNYKYLSISTNPNRSLDNKHQRKYLLNKPVKIFVMGENKWRDEDDWPLPNTKYIPYYFHSEGNANTKNGLLSTDKPENEKSDKFVFDPLNPVPTLGGQVILPGEGAIGPRDQTTVENRDDVLAYETGILNEDITVIGPLIAKLFISSDCKDTDFTVKIKGYETRRVFGCNQEAAEFN